VLTITQSLIADMLGVRREGVTVTVGNLEKAGLFIAVAITLPFWIARVWRRNLVSVTPQYDRRSHSEDVAGVRVQRSASRVSLLV